MQQTIRELDLQNHPFILKELEFVTAVFNKHKGLLSNTDGFKLFFYKQSEAIKNEFPEKEFYPIKIEKLKKAFAEFEQKQIIESISKSISTAEELTKELMLKKDLSEADITIYKKSIGNLKTSLELENHLKKINLYFNDLKKHLPDFEIGNLHETWSIQMNQKAECNFRSEEGVELLSIALGNYMYIPTNENVDIRIVYTGYKPFRLIGSGSMEYWQQVDGKWREIYSRQTWIG
jgi:hypothetical protein